VTASAVDERAPRLELGTEDAHRTRRELALPERAADHRVDGVALEDDALLSALHFGTCLGAGADDFARRKRAVN
jgi:hypothetical protein